VGTILEAKQLVMVANGPKKADAILTDGIGARLEDSLTQLYGAPVDKDVDKDKAGKTEFAHPAMRPLSSSRGVVFLVNRTSRDVLWSTFERPKNTQPEELRHAAEKIVDRLAKTNTAK